MRLLELAEQIKPNQVLINDYDIYLISEDIETYQVLKKLSDNAFSHIGKVGRLSATEVRSGDISKNIGELSNEEVIKHLFG